MRGHGGRDCESAASPAIFVELPHLGTSWHQTRRTRSLTTTANCGTPGRTQPDGDLLRVAPHCDPQNPSRDDSGLARTAVQWRLRPLPWRSRPPLSPSTLVAMSLRRTKCSASMPPDDSEPTRGACARPAHFGGVMDAAGLVDERSTLYIKYYLRPVEYYKCTAFHM